MIGPHVPPPWPVYLPDPIAGHGLNEGLLAWHLSLPGLSGGRQSYDLAGRFQGTLSGQDAASGWRSTTRPGGTGHLVFDGIDDQVSLGNPPALQQLSMMTVACWVRVDAAGRQDFAGQWGAGHYHWALIAGLTAGKFSFFVNQSNDFPEAQSSVTFIVGQWYHVVGTYDGVSLIIYINGIESGSSAYSFVLRQDSALNVYIGRTDDDYGSVSVDSFKIYNRPLTAIQVWGVYDSERAGSPGVLNRWRPTFTTVDSISPTIVGVGVAGTDAAGTIPAVLKGPRTLTIPVGVGDGSAIVPARIVGPLIRTPAPAVADGTSAVPAVIRSPLTRAVPVASVDALDMAPARIIGPITRITPASLADVSDVTPTVMKTLPPLPVPVASDTAAVIAPIAVPAAVTIPTQPASAAASAVIPGVTPSKLTILPSVITVNVSAAVPAVLHVTLTLATPPATSTVVASAPVPAGTTLLTVAPSVTNATTMAPVPVPGPVILAAPVATVPIVAIAPALVPGLTTPVVSVVRTDGVATSPASSSSLLSLPPGRAGADATAVAPDVPGGPVTRVPGVAAGRVDAAGPGVVLTAVNLSVNTSISNVNAYSVNVTLPSIVLLTSSSVVNSVLIPVLPIPSPVSLTVPSAYATMITADTALVLPFLIITTTVADASALALSPDSAQGVPPLVPGTAGIDGIAISPDLIPSGTALIGVPVAEADVTATGAGISAEPAESLTEAIIQAFHASPLALEFGETNPEWRPKIRVRKAFAGDEPPYVVLAGGEDARARGESPDADGNSYPIEESTFQATIYAESDADARDLGEAFSDYMIGQSEKGALRFAGGTVMLFGRINPYQAPFRDPEEGPGGGYVYGQVLRFRVIIGA